MKDCVVDKLKALAKKQKDQLANGEEVDNYDCADTALTAMMQCGQQLSTPMRFRHWDASKKKWVYTDKNDYDNPNDFQDAVRNNVGAIGLINNTRPQRWSDLEPGDLMIYDLRYHNQQDNGEHSYGGHTMNIVEKTECPNEDTCWKTIEGHLNPPITSGSYTKEDFLNSWNGPYNDKYGKTGRYWDWDDIFK